MDFISSLISNSRTPEDLQKTVEQITKGEIQEVNLCNCDLTDENVAELCKALLTNNTVKEMRLAGNKITAEGAKAIADVLATNATITALDLNLNSIEDAGAASLAHALRDNDTLTSLTLYDNGISMIGDNHLLYAMAQNTTLRFLDLQYEEGFSDTEIQNKIKGFVQRNSELPSSPKKQLLDFRHTFQSITDQEESDKPKPELEEQAERDYQRWLQQTWRQGRYGGKTAAFATFSEEVKAGALNWFLQQESEKQQYGEVAFVPKQRTGKVFFFASLPDWKKISILQKYSPRVLPPWRAGKKGGKVAAFASLSPSEKAVALNSLHIDGAPIFTATRATGKVAFFATLPDDQKVEALEYVQRLLVTSPRTIEQLVRPPTPTPPITPALSPVDQGTGPEKTDKALQSPRSTANKVPPPLSLTSAKANDAKNKPTSGACSTPVSPTQTGLPDRYGYVQPYGPIPTYMPPFRTFALPSPQVAQASSIPATYVVNRTDNRIYGLPNTPRVYSQPLQRPPAPPVQTYVPQYQYQPYTVQPVPNYNYSPQWTAGWMTPTVPIAIYGANNGNAVRFY
eukprot:TRINITY_DN82360_c0_g1_i1.p1 TRINITY_DN82360_c0_g1~~TRINITY_DN82360_c0_g1_i1.p1  ORF type:complete len:568 (+),score=116.96 TRINITY_DN82360_c0_g1_i1:69-1772(+)